MIQKAIYTKNTILQLSYNRKMTHHPADNTCTENNHHAPHTTDNTIPPFPGNIHQHK